jgi:septation ring formation regulator EzrA
MNTEWELDEGIKSVKNAWQREHTARCNLEKMLENAESENVKLKEVVGILYELVEKEYPYSFFEKAAELMRELGMEVNW